LAGHLLPRLQPRRCPARRPALAAAAPRPGPGERAIRRDGPRQGRHHRDRADPVDRAVPAVRARVVPRAAVPPHRVLQPASAPDHPSEPFFQSGVTGTIELLRADGTKVGGSAGTLNARFAVPAAPGDYRLVVTAARDPGVSQVSSRIQVSWTFRSDHVPGDKA